MPFQPIVTQRLYQQVAEQIGDLIRSGEFQPGDRLPPERDLAKSLGASRPVVREAMVALEMAGLVEVRTGSGTYVKAQPIRPTPGVAPLADDTGPSPFDIIAARIMIEGEAAFAAAVEATDEDVAAIADLVETMRRQMAAGEPTQDTDRLMHVRIAAATHNTVLPPIIENLWTGQYAPMFAALSQRTRLPENLEATLRDHCRVAEAIANRDPAAAREAMRAHLAQVLGVLMRDDDPDADSQLQEAASGRDSERG